MPLRLEIEIELSQKFARAVQQADLAAGPEPVLTAEDGRQQCGFCP